MKERNPLVSIICDVFNHEQYIKDCLEGLVCQKTTFDYIILIHDDASTDDSQVIIKEYIQKYPNLFLPIFQKENQYSKGISIWKIFQLTRAKTKYVAFCEGDDYWTDQYKLQKQVDFLEEHPNYSAVFGNIIVRDERLSPVIETPSDLHKHLFSIKDVLSGTVFPFASICVRDIVIEKCLNSEIKANGDMLMSYYATSIGIVYMLDDYMSVYRKTGKGVCTSKTLKEQLIGELSEWHSFHEQLHFPYPLTLVEHQSQKIFQFCIKSNPKNLPIKRIIKEIRLCYLPIYITYILIYGIKHVKHLL